MKYYGDYGCGAEILPQPVSVTMECEIGVPADKLNVVFSCVIPQLRMIYMCDGDFSRDNIIFIGYVDVQKTDISQSGITVTIEARSPASLPLDSDCESGQYTDPASDILFEEHLKAFGITNGSEITCADGALNIPKGESHYGAVERFCTTLCNTTPRIDSLGVFFVDAYRDDEKEIIFENGAGISFSRVEHTKRRSALVSSVIVNSGGRVCVCTDDSAVNDGIVRERRLDLSCTLTGTLADADRIIESGRQNSEQVRLWCSGYLGDILGMRAKVRGLGSVDINGQLYIASVKYNENKNEQITIVNLNCK